MPNSPIFVALLIFLLLGSHYHDDGSLGTNFPKSQKCKDKSRNKSAQGVVIDSHNNYLYLAFNKLPFVLY